jgi:hypothetical protein
VDPDKSPSVKRLGNDEKQEMRERWMEEMGGM